MADPVALSDRQLDDFLIDGYLVVEPSTLGPADHEHLYGEAAGLYDLARTVRSPTNHLDILGDNLRARIPALDRLLADPAVDGALTTLLGPDHLVHPHSYCHCSSDRDQPFHQDGNLPWNERGHYRSHRPDWLMVFYYPQAVDLTNGPTEIAAGTQYWTVDHEQPDGGWHPGDRLDRSVDDATLADDDLAARDVALRRSLDHGLGVPGITGEFLTVPAGSVVVAHYDLVHRGSRTAGAPERRYLYKFYCARVRPPRAAAVTRGRRQDISGARRPSTGTAVTDTTLCTALAPIVAANRRWLTGGRDPVAEADDPGPDGAATDADALADALARWRTDLGSDREHLRVAAAYELGRRAESGDADALSALADALRAPTEGVRRAAGHGLRQAGRAALPALLDAVHAPDATVRRPAIAALGSETATADPAAVDALVDRLATDPDDLARSNAAYSLGQLARRPDLDPAPLVDALVHRLQPGVEPDNAFNAAFARSTIRQSAAFALVQALANHELDPDRIASILDLLPAEPDRYVQGLLVEGLTRTTLSTPALNRRLLSFLTARRWTPTPGPDPAVDPETRLR